jgi:hypothetical protein
MRFEFKPRFLMALLLSIQVAACLSPVDDQTPKKTLDSYIDLSFKVEGIEDRKKLESLLTGDTLQRLSSWSDEQFLKAFEKNKRKKESLTILETSKANDSEYALTYEIVFTENNNGKDARITQRKMALISKSDEGWKIREVQSKRESVEYLSELSLP